MASYGRNFDFRVPPRSGERTGRNVLTDTGLSGGTSVPIGAPVVYDSAEGVNDDFTAARSFKLATGAQAPAPGRCGILVYEHAPAAFAGDDPFLTTYSDKDTAPVGKLVQVVSGDTVKVMLKNTADRTFLNTRDYTGRKMVAGLGGATPTIAVGDYLTPGTGNDTAGYWAETGSATNAWLVVTAVDNDRAEVEAQFLF
jgi:hypothetical protein